MKLLICLLACAFFPPQDEGPKMQTPDVEVEFRGKLRHGVVAIGGETTGTTITAGDVTWELELDPALEAFAAAHHKESVAVSGKLKHVRGTEIRNRWIVKVKSISEWTPTTNDAPRVQVAFRGRLRTGVVAIGGETTGVEISDDGVTMELDLGDQPQLMKQADDLHKKTVLARGRLEQRKGVERPDRLVIHVDSLRPAPE